MPRDYEIAIQQDYENQIAELRAELAAERERADKAKDKEHRQWVRALLRVLPEERAVLFREICLARAALGGGDE